MNKNTGRKREQTPRPETEDVLRKSREDLYAVEERLRQAESAPSSDSGALRTLLRVIEQVNTELDVERVLRLSAQRIIDVFGAERVFMADVSGQGRIEFRLAVTYTGEEVPNPGAEVSHAVFRGVVKNRTPVLVADATTDPRFALVSSIRHMQLHSVMAAPLLAGEELLGVVYADNRMVTGAFGQRTLDLLGVFACHVGIALKNAQLFRQLSEARSELALAERLKAIGQVATFVVHEIKNPLSSIQILVDGLQEHWRDESLRSRVFSVVPAEIARLNRAVNQILEYARPTPLLKVETEMSRLLNSAIDSLAAEMDARGIAVVRDYASDLPEVQVDGERIRQVLMNLLKNAAEALAGREKAQVKVRLRHAPNHCQEIAIEDNGPGIPEDRMQSIFEPFKTFKATGSGIGLALCQKLVREHEGRITVENAASGGARFRIILPVGKA